MAQHTLAECPAWEELRCGLVSVVGHDLSLLVFVAKMIGSEEAWKAAVSFCEAVMLAKETAERIRRQEAAAEKAAAAMAAVAAAPAAPVGSDSESEEEESIDGDAGAPPPPLPRRVLRRRGGRRGPHPLPRGGMTIGGR